MAVAERHGLRVAVCVENATPHEVKLATSTLVQMVVPEAPENLIADRAYDSDKFGCRTPAIRDRTDRSPSQQSKEHYTRLPAAATVSSTLEN